MKKNLFEMGADWDDGWASDNRANPAKEPTKLKSPSEHRLHFSKEKRRGKIVTIIQPFYLDKKELQALLKGLKKKLGTGGTAKDNSLEFQGEIQEKARHLLEVDGYRFRS